MVRLRMRVVLLPVVALRLTPVPVLVTIMLFSFRTEPLQIRIAPFASNTGAISIGLSVVFDILFVINTFLLPRI